MDMMFYLRKGAADCCDLTEINYSSYNTRGGAIG